MDGPVPVVLFEHNVEYLIWKRLATLETSPWKRVLFEMEWRKVRAREADACRQADLTVAVSEDDKERLLELGADIRATAIPTGVDTAYFKPGGFTEIPTRLVFSGSMDWHPNEDAVCYFVDNVSCRASGRCARRVIHHRRPQPGRPCSRSGQPARRRRHGHGRRCTARLLAQRACTSCRCEPAAARGSRFSRRLPWAKRWCRPPWAPKASRSSRVATSWRRTPHTISRSRSIRLLRDPARRQALGDAGRALVEANYSWATVARQFEERCEEVVAEHAYAGRQADRGAHLSRAGSPRHRGARVVAGEHHEIGWSHHHS